MRKRRTYPEAKREIKFEKMSSLTWQWITRKITNSPSIFPYHIRCSAEIKSVNFNPKPSIVIYTNMYANYDKLVCCVFNIFSGLNGFSSAPFAKRVPKVLHVKAIPSQAPLDSIN